MAVNVTLADEIDVSRGDMLVHTGNLPRIERDFEAMLVWMAEEPLAVDRQYFFKHTHTLVSGDDREAALRVDVNTLEQKPPRRCPERGRPAARFALARDPVRRLRAQPRDGRVHPDRPRDERHRRRGHDPAAPVRTGARPFVLGDRARERAAAPQDEPGLAEERAERLGQSPRRSCSRD